ncbi:circadian-associated transcriptional repressor [Seriola lalandi dorsalis]|uniref:Circadian associated repressor of transcription n=1 Tax=Seriola lalandi dorsalis TaxID=1841481 RepID=A0A3B4XV44_SERLL|nr:circadian-associated transcriptional repressor [Seriola lalandi dorsalis]
MQSQGSTSSQPSFDSLSSSDSLLFSDSEQAEDDTDVFLTDNSSSVIIGEAGGPTANADGGSESPGSQWACDGFTDKEEEEESYRLESGSKAAHIRLDERDPTSQIPKSEGDLLFAQKCAELQGFVRPLLELLNGLKRGRFDRGLSSFQQSVAMDRIQRIVGVLQRPNSGEKYLNTLLQVEMMLKLWFPQIPTQPVSAASSVATSPARSLQDTSSSTPPHKHRDQLHIPVKKRRLSWTGTDAPAPSAALLKCPRIRGEEKRVKQDQDEREDPPPPSLASDASQNPPDVAGNSQLNDDTKGKDSDSEELGKLSKYKAGQRSEPSLTWVHVAPILSPRKACNSHEGTTAAVNNENQPVTAILPPSRRGSPATQDSSISSTTPYKHPKNLKKPIRCQSQPVAGQQSESETVKACQGQSQSPHVTLKPLPRVCPTPLET